MVEGTCGLDPSSWMGCPPADCWWWLWWVWLRGGWRKTGAYISVDFSCTAECIYYAPYGAYSGLAGGGDRGSWLSSAFGLALPMDWWGASKELLPYLCLPRGPTCLRNILDTQPSQTQPCKLRHTKIVWKLGRHAPTQEQCAPLSFDLEARGCRGYMCGWTREPSHW